MIERRFDQGYPSLMPGQGLVGPSTGLQRRQAPGWFVSPLMRPAHQSPVFTPRTPQHVSAADVRGNPEKREGRDSFLQRVGRGHTSNNLWMAPPETANPHGSMSPG